MPAPLGRSLAQRHTTVRVHLQANLKCLSAELCIPYLYAVQLIIPTTVNCREICLGHLP